MRLNNEDRNRLEYVKKCFQGTNIYDFTNEEVQEMQDLLLLLCTRRVLQDLEINGANAFRKIGDFQIFEKWLEEVDGDMTTNRELSSYAEDILREIVEHKDNKGDCDSNYWEQRFEKLSGQEDAFVRSCFKELREHDFINIMWADNYPYYLTITSKGLSYYDNLSASVQQKGVHIHPNLIEISRPHIEKKYDVFLSHANKDKLDYVDGLYESLQKLGIKIFYDKKVLEWGDDWKRVILDGTDTSEFAIIVISENFFGREWTERELSEFLSRQNNSGQKIVLPLLYNVTISKLSEIYPSLADIQVVETSKHSIEDITILFAKQLIKRIKQNQ